MSNKEQSRMPLNEEIALRAAEAMKAVDEEGMLQFLSFNLDTERFALDIVKVREVLDYTKPTKVPNTPDFMRGVINLRGSVVPVVDMRLKFGMPEGGLTVDTCIIIVEVMMEGEPTVIGALADSVHEVVSLAKDDIEPAPALGTHINTEFLRGMGKHAGGFLLILEIDRVFSLEELSATT